MDQKIMNLLNEEISTQLQALSGLDAGSNEKSTAIDDVVALYKLRIDELKIENEATDKRENRENIEKSNSREDEFKQKQIEEQNKDRYIRIGIAAAELIVPLMFYGVWMKRGFMFEEHGAFTSTTFRGLFSRFKQTKK